MTFSLIASVGAGSSNGMDVTTGAIDSTGANLLIAWCSGHPDFSAAPTDSKSNTWNALTAQSQPGGERGIFYYSIPTSVGASHTFSLTDSLPGLCVQAWSGSHATPFDQQNGANSGFGTSYQPGSITPTENDELVVCGLAFNTSGAAVSIDSGFTISSQFDQDGNRKGSALAYLVQTTAGAVNPTWSTHLTAMVAAIASFKVAGGGGSMIGAGLIRTSKLYRRSKVA